MEALRAGEAIMLEKQKVERRRDPPSLKDEAQQSIRWISGLGWAGLAGKRAGGSRAAFPGRAKRLAGAASALSALPVGEHRRAPALSCSGLLREQTRVAEDGPGQPERACALFAFVGTLARCWGMCDNKHFGRLQSFSKKRKEKRKKKFTSTKEIPLCLSTLVNEALVLPSYSTACACMSQPLQKQFAVLVLRTPYRYRR